MDDNATSVIATPEIGKPEPSRSAAPAARPAAGGHRRSAWPILLGLVAIGGVGAGAYAYIEGNRQKAAPPAGPSQHPASAEDEQKPDVAAPGMRVEVMHPRQGGLDRKLTQVCAVHAFEHAQLYAKISGFLKEQSVDIGDRVKRDQLLAVIYVPEILKAVDQAKAALDQANAMVKVAEAKIRSAQSLKKASIAMLGQRKAEVAAKTAFREYRYKRQERIRGLVLKNAVEKKLLDEAIDQFEASVGDEKASEAAVLTAEADIASKQALIEEAQADLIDARANVEVATANLEKAQVMASYTRITSPYDGVVTLRSFHHGDFIRSASEGGNVPLLAVAHTDVMRVVIPVPDTQVPFVDRKDKATISVYGLEGRNFEGAVSRFSESEDAQDRAMRTEVDLENTDGKLREGMYGLATILLQPALAQAVTVPSSSLQKTAGAAGELFVVRDGKAHKVDVKIGMDNGNEAEIVSGLTTGDSVIASYNGALGDGTPVTAEPAKLVQSSK